METSSVTPVTIAQPPKIQFWTFDAEITAMHNPLPGLYVYRFRLDKPITFVAGQYVSVFLPGKKPAPFSIASSPEQHDALELGVEVVGPVTTAMSQMKVGDRVPLKGPFGKFVMTDTEQQVCYLAGGVGITPFMSMLRWIRDTHQDGRHATLFYSCKTQDQFLWREELETMMRECPNMKIILTITREAPPSWPHKTGRIDEKMIREAITDVPGTVYYSCGPVPLIDAMFALLRTMGVPESNLKREPWH